MSKWSGVFLAGLFIAIRGSYLFASATTQPIFLDNDDDDRKGIVTTTAISGFESTRYFFGLLDSRSSYGNDFFHDPLIGPEFDCERQIEVDYAHTEASGFQGNEVDGGFQWTVIGNLTVAAEFGYDWEHQINNHGGADGDDTVNENSRGFEDVNVAIYHPFFQYISPDKAFDYTAVARLDVGIPTRTPQSGTDVQLTPYLAQLLRVGDNLSLEAWLGPQITIAPDQTNILIYGASFGYEIFHKQVPIPLVSVLTPIFEIDGVTPFSSTGQEALFGACGFDVSFETGTDIHPQIEIGYQFPMDKGARGRLRSGLLVQLFLDF